MQTLVQAIDSLKLSVDVLKQEFESVITDQSLPLEERWELFEKAPDYLKKTSGWVYHFECLKDKPEDHDSRAEEDIYENENRGAHLCAVDIVETIIGNHKDYEVGEEYRSLVTPEQIPLMQEEIMSQNMGYICYDW